MKRQHILVALLLISTCHVASALIPFVCDMPLLGWILRFLLPFFCDDDDDLCNDDSDCLHDGVCDARCECQSGWMGDFCETDIDECSSGIHDCDLSKEGCINFDGNYYCYCKDDGFELSPDGTCQAIDPVERAIVEDLLQSYSEPLVDSFPQEVVDEMVQDFTLVPGTMTFSNADDLTMEEEGVDLFTIDSEAVTDSITVEGYYVPSEAMAGSIPDDLLVRVYFQDGLRASASVDSITGAFSVTLADVPYGFSPFIVAFVSESYNGGDDSGRSLLGGGSMSQEICMLLNNKACGPAFALTLSWDTPTADVDLHVYEPGGAHVYYDNAFGDNGSYLDRDDTDGFGPEHYYAPTTVFTDTNYQIQVEMFDYHEDTSTDVNWNLVAHSFGQLLWATTGTFRMGVTQDASDFIPWIFEEEPICQDQSCDSCGVVPDLDVDDRRKLGVAGLADRAPLNWVPVEGEASSHVTWAINWHYVNYDRMAINPLYSADLLNRAFACVLDFLTDDEKQRIVDSLGSTTDIQTAVAAAKAVYNEFEEERARPWWRFPYVCRHHALALHAVLSELGFDASVEAAASYTSVPHTWNEVEIDGERYILDSFNQYYIHVKKLEGPGCIYEASEDRVSCTDKNLYADNVSFDFTCSTVDHWLPLPKGRYFIGDETDDHGVDWYNLYAEREYGSVWDYATRVPEKYCRGGFGFHSGTISAGCITVPEEGNCFNKVMELVGKYQKTYNPTRYQVSACNILDVKKMSILPLYPVVVVSQ